MPMVKGKFQEPTNSDRAEWGMSVLKHFSSLTGSDLKTDEALRDLLADLMHTCDLKKWDFAECVRLAEGMYAEEKNSDESVKKPAEEPEEKPVEEAKASLAESVDGSMAKVLWFDKECGIGVVRTIEGHEYHISADSLALIEQDSLGEIRPGMVVRVNPAATSSGSMMLAIEKVSKDDEYLYYKQESERADQMIPESKKKPGNLKEDLESEREKVVEELVNEFKHDAKDVEELRKEIVDSLDFTKGRYSDWGDAGKFTADGTEYNLIASDDEAEKIAVTLTKQDMESEPEIFNQDFIKSYMTITDTDRRVIANEEADARMEDMKYDATKEKWSDVFDRTELYKDEYEDLQSKLDASEDKAETAELDKQIAALAEKSIVEWGEAEVDRVYDLLEDPIDYFVNELGAYTVEDLMKQKFISIDVEAAAQAAVDTDGWAHFISLYNGDYKETKSGFVFFRED